MKRILLIGINGQVGQELKQTLAPLGEIIGLGRQQLDLSQSEKIPQAISEIKPEIIVNAAAYTAVDKAESETELANIINGIAPEIMALEAEKIGAKLVHISTDYVFNGEKNTPYLEEDPTNPLSIYGKTKLAGEERIQKNCHQYIILRTAWVYGNYGKGNFVKTMLRLAKEREQLRVVVDQIGSPTWAKNIAETITNLLKNEATNGIYHFTNSGVASWYDFAIAIFEEAKQRGIPLKIKEVAPITTAEYPTPAHRPKYSVLSNKKVTEIAGKYAPHWRESLREMLDNYQQ